jgi:hypothetical protein
MSKLSQDMLKVLDDFMNSSTEGHRQELDQYIHTCDVSYETLVRGQTHITDFRKVHKDFIEALKTELRSPIITSEKELVRKIYDSGTDHLKYNFQSFLVINGKEMVLVSPSRDALRDNVTKAQKGMKDGVEMQIGHIVTRDRGGISTTPAAQKLGNLRFEVGQLGKGIPRGLRSTIDNAIEDLARVHKSIRTSFDRNTSGIQNWSIGQTLIKGSISVTLETIDSNLGKANLERRAVKKVRDLIKTGSYASDLAKLAKQDVLDSILAGLKGTTPKAKQGNIESSEITNTSTKTTKVNRATVSFRDSRGRFTSISAISLKELINNRLEDQLTSNMGEGDRKDILNYDTGNFASTTKVTSVSADRATGIEIFYSYMKYRPGTGKHHAYDSFEPGNAQGMPLSRNPQLLVERSIREIASTLVSNKLRIVSV